MDVGRLCTGLVVALRGYETDKGDFHVLQLLLPDMGPQTPAPRVNAARPQYLVRDVPLSCCSVTAMLQVLVSGLHVASGDPLPLQMLCDWLSGHFGSPQVDRCVTMIAPF